MERKEKLKRKIYVYAKHIYWIQSTCNVIHTQTTLFIKPLQLKVEWASAYIRCRTLSLSLSIARFLPLPRSFPPSLPSFSRFLSLSLRKSLRGKVDGRPKRFWKKKRKATTLCNGNGEKTNPYCLLGKMYDCIGATKRVSSASRRIIILGDARAFATWLLCESFVCYVEKLSLTFWGIFIRVALLPRIVLRMKCSGC